MKTQALILLISIFFSVALNGQDTVVTIFPDTNNKWEKMYEDGLKTEEKIYYEDDSEWMTVKYDPDAVQKWKWYHENGNPYFEATIVNDLLQGKYQIWYDNGQLAEEIYFIDNSEDGVAKFYHRNGQLAMKGQYKNGKMIGEWQFFDDQGNLPSGNWEWVFAASTENIRMKGMLQDGARKGVWRYNATANQGCSNQKRFSIDFGK